MTESNLRTRSLRVRGLQSPVIEAGPEGADEAVVFVHGNPGSSQDWAALVAGTGRFARAVAFDLPGYGGADKPVDFRYTVEGYSDHLAAMIETLGIRRAHLVLHDLGGPWGLTWATAHKPALASIALLNTGVLPGYRWHYLAQIWRTPVAGELFMAAANRTAFGLILRHGNGSGLPRAFVDRMHRDFDAGTRRAVLRFYRATSDLPERSDAVIRALKPLNTPALVIWGRNDPYLPVRYAESQRLAFPDAQIHLLDDSGHWPMADRPDAVRELLLPFLQARTNAG